MVAKADEPDAAPPAGEDCGASDKSKYGSGNYQGLHRAFDAGLADGLPSSGSTRTKLKNVVPAKVFEREQKCCNQAA
jgi:hypothetical protein